MATKKCLDDANLYSDSHKLTKRRREKRAECSIWTSNLFSISYQSGVTVCGCVCVCDCVQVGQWDAFLLICVSVYISLDNLDYPWMRMCIFLCTWTLQQEDVKEAVIRWNHAWQYMWSHVWGESSVWLCAELRWHFQPACLWLEATGDRAATSLPGWPGPH